MKLCHKCSNNKPILEFYKDKSRNDGLSPYCKSCTKIQRHQYYSGNKEQIQSKVRSRRITDKERFRQYDLNKARDNYEGIIFQSTKYRAKVANMEHTISKEDIIIPETCPYLDVPLTRIHGQGQVPTNASLDRIDNSKGYIKGNIQVISKLANRMKNHATEEQLIQFAKSVLDMG